MTPRARTARLDVLFSGYARLPHVAGTVSLGARRRPCGRGRPGHGPDPGRPARPAACARRAPAGRDRRRPEPPPPRPHARRGAVPGGAGPRRTRSVRLLATPGHTPQDVTTLVGTPDDVVALTHLWWTDQGPEEDPYAPDREVLRQQRERILDLVTLVVPGHGAPFRPGASTPR